MIDRDIPAQLRRRRIGIAEGHQHAGHAGRPGGVSDAADAASDATTDAAADAAGSVRWSATVHSLTATPGGIRIFTAEHPQIAVDCSSSAAVSLDLRPGARLSFSLSPADVSVRPSP